MHISLIVAVNTNNVIGKNNQLLWHLPNDMKFFKNTTWAMPVLMGRKTFDSMGKPLSGRMNIVISRQENWKAEGVLVHHTLLEGIQRAEENDFKEIFIIGGGEIYKEAMLYADTLYLTKVDAEMDGDSFFPIIDTNRWLLVSEQSFPIDEKHAFEYHFQKWGKNK